jgi:hypothetical protein
MSAPQEPCPDCKGTGILMGLQWGSSEWPGCSTCAPDFMCIGVVRGPENVPPPGIGMRRPFVGEPHAAEGQQ